MRHKLKKRQLEIVHNVYRLIGKAANELGHWNEQRVVAAFKDRSDLPDWFRGIHLATRSEDQIGIDVIVDTDVGKIFLQIKSSEMGKQKFLWRQQLKTHPVYIAVAVILIHDEFQDIRQKIIEEVTRLRECFLARRHEYQPEDNI